LVEEVRFCLVCGQKKKKQFQDFMPRPQNASAFRQLLSELGNTSVPSSVKNRIQSFEFNASIGGGKLPVSLVRCLITPLLKCGTLVAECFFISNTVSDSNPC
jgi:hypothetical protein